MSADLFDDAVEVLEIDIATRFVEEDEDIFVIRPGAGFSLYPTFERESIVFLDFPGLELDFAKRPPPQATTQLREQLVRSIRLRDWHKGGQQSKEPARTLAAYRGKAAGRRLSRYVGDVGRLFYQFEPGTIVMIPGPGYISDVLIGTIVGPPEEVTNVGLYPGEKMPIRRVKWLGRKLKASFTPDLRKSLARPDPVMRIDIDHREEVLRAAFDQYAFEGTFAARLETTKTEFSTLDDFNLQSFTNFIAGVALAPDQPDSALGSVDLAAALGILAANPDAVPDLASNINSPGFLRLSSAKIVPLTIAVIMTAVLNTPVGAQTPEIRIRNSAALKTDPCAVQIEDQAHRVMKMSSSIELLRVCAQLRDAASKTGLKTAMSAKRLKAPKRK